MEVALNILTACLNFNELKEQVCFFFQLDTSNQGFHADV